MSQFDFVNAGDRQDALIIGRAFTKSFTIADEDLSAWSCRFVVFDLGNSSTIKADWRSGAEITITLDGSDTVVTLTLAAAETATLAEGSWRYYAELYADDENPLTLGEGVIQFIDRPGAE